MINGEGPVSYRESRIRKIVVENDPKTETSNLRLRISKIVNSEILRHENAQLRKDTYVYQGVCATCDVD